MTAPSDRYSPDPNILERKVGEYLEHLNSGRPHEHRERTTEEAASITRISRRAVMWAAAAGIVSGGIIGGGEVYMRVVMLDGMEDLPWQTQLYYWTIFFAFAGVVSAVEIVFLYWTALRAIARTTQVSGVVLGSGAYADLTARGLARAALEFPNPRVEIFGIDPYAYMPGWQIAARNIAYKLKVGVSSFLLRVFLRRVLGRMAVRGIVPLVAGPLYAIWNALITWRIMNEARIRMLGPFAIEELIGRISEKQGELSPGAADLMLQGVGEALKRACDAHPNYVALLARLRDVLGSDVENLEVDWESARGRLAQLEPAERELILDVLVLATILGSTINSGQKLMLGEACGKAGAGFRPAALDLLRNKLKTGRRIGPEDLAAVRK